MSGAFLFEWEKLNKTKRNLVFQNSFFFSHGLRLGGRTNLSCHVGQDQKWLSVDLKLPIIPREREGEREKRFWLHQN